MQWTWELADPRRDVENICSMAQEHFEHEVDGILKTDPEVFKHAITMATVNQMFDKRKEFIAVARIDNYSIAAFCWFDRSGYTTYSREEISNARFHHVDLTLPVRTRYKLINEMIDQHVLWSNMCGVPVICSTSIRGEHDAFMRIHAKRGFKVMGSYAWIRTEEAMKALNGN